MLLNVVLFVLGAAWLQQQPELPSVFWLYPYAAAVLAWPLVPAGGSRGRLFLRRAGTSSLWFAGGFLWAALVAHVKLADYLPPEWEGRDVSVARRDRRPAGSTDRGVRFEFDVEQVNTPLARVPRHITVFWYAEGSGAPAGVASRRRALGSQRAPAASARAGQSQWFRFRGVVARARHPRHRLRARRAVQPALAVDGVAPVLPCRACPRMDPQPHRLRAARRVERRRSRGAGSRATSRRSPAASGRCLPGPA